MATPDATVTAQLGPVTTAIVQAIRSTQLACKKVVGTPYGQSVLDVCRLAGQTMVMLKKQMNALKKPYIVQRPQILKVVNALLQVLDRLKIVVEGLPPDASVKDVLKLIKIAHDAVMGVLTWIDTDPDSYGDFIQTAAAPSSLDVAFKDLSTAPRWLVKDLFNARAALAIVPGSLAAEETVKRIEESAQSASVSLHEGDLNEELTQLQHQHKVQTAQVASQLQLIDRLKAELSKTAQVGQAALQRQDLINSNLEELSEKDKTIATLTAQLSEANAKNLRLTDKVSNLSTQNSTVGEALNQDIVAKNTQIQQRDEHIQKLTEKLKELHATNSGLVLAEKQVDERDEHIQKLSEKMKELLASVGNYKKKAREDKAQLKEVQEQKKQSEAKLRMSKAQLRMSRVVAQPSESTEDLFTATLLSELEQLEHGSEIDHIESLLDNLLSDHQSDIDSRRNATKMATKLESAQTVNEVTLLEVDYATAQHWLSDAEKRECLAKVLYDPSQSTFESIALLGTLFTSGKVAENMVRCVMNIFERQGRALEIAYHMISEEVQRLRSPIQLFRGEEFPARMIRCYSRMIGMQYAHKVLGSLIHEMCVKQVRIELDTNRVKEGEPKLNLVEQQRLLEHYCQSFFQTIVDHLPSMPIDFLRITHRLTIETKKKWPEPEAVQGAVAGFIFLRFFCPCIAAPESFDFPSVSPPHVRRSLLLIGKVLQSLANGVTDFKEPYLKVMVPFLDKTRPALEKYIQVVKQWPPKLSGNADYMKMMEYLVEQKKVPLLEGVKPETPYADIGRSHWTQNVVSAPITRFTNTLSSLPLTPTHTLDSGVFPGNKDAAIVQSLLLTYLDNESVPSAIVRFLNSHKDSGSATIISQLGTLFLANDSLEFLTKTVVLTEISGSLTAHQYLHESLSKTLFSWYCRTYVGKWLSSVWEPILNEVIAKNDALEVEPSQLTPLTARNANSSAVRLTELYKLLIGGALNALDTAPFPLWEFFSVIVDYTSQDPLQFLLSSYFAPAMEELVGFQLLSAQSFTAESARTFVLLSDIFRSLSSEKSQLLHSMPLDRAVLDGWKKQVRSWAAGEPDEVVEEDIGISWTTERSVLLSLTNFLLANKSAIVGELGISSSVSHTVTFSLDEILSSLKAPATPPTWDQVKTLPTSPAVASAVPPLKGGKSQRMSVSNISSPRFKFGGKKEKDVKQKDKEGKQKEKEVKQKKKDRVSTE